MDAKDYLKNGLGDVLSPVQNNETHALFQVCGQDAKFKDIFFLASVERKTDAYGTKLHLEGADKWEREGTYIKGKKNALAKFEELANPEKKNTDELYKNL
jgi:hypothetical protein